MIENQPEAHWRSRVGFFGAGYPLPSSPSATARMVANRSKDTRPEMVLRSALHQSGLRFRVHHAVRVDAGRPIVIDVAFTRQRLAVFIDGCFWHACPIHGSRPKANAAYWKPKLARNTQRDRETTGRLKRAGWRVIRIWEHEDAAIATAGIVCAVSGEAGDSAHMTGRH